MNSLMRTGILLCLLSGTYFAQAQIINQKVVDKAVEMLTNDLHVRGDYNSCVYLDEQTFVDSARTFIAEYADQFAYTEDPAEIAALAQEAIIQAEEQVVLQEGLFYENYATCKEGVIASFIPPEVTTEDEVTDEETAATEDTESTEEAYYYEEEKTEVPDFVINFPTFEPHTIVDQTDNLGLWYPEAGNGRPSIIFGIDAELDSVKSFYLAELPDYHQIYMGDMLIMTEKPFDIRDLFKEEGRDSWYDMKSVWIEPNNAYADEFPGLVKVEIHY